MATSGTIDSTLTAGAIVKNALRDLGVIRKNEEPTAAMASDGLRILNTMLKEWQTDGLNLWREDDGAVTFDAGEATKELATRVIDVNEARVVLAGGTERPLARWEYGDYVTLPNKASPGVPTIYCPRKTRTAYSLTLWPVPTVETVVNYSAARVVEDVTALTEEVDAPQEWLSTVTTNLAARMAPGFGLVDPNIFVIREAARLYMLMRSADRPASYYMGPAYGGSR